MDMRRDRKIMYGNARSERSIDPFAFRSLTAFGKRKRTRLKFAFNSEGEYRDEDETLSLEDIILSCSIMPRDLSIAKAP